MILNYNQLTINLIIKRVLVLISITCCIIISLPAVGQNEYTESRNEASMDAFPSDNEADVLIFPNPSRAIFNFKIINIPTNDNELSIFNSMGKCVTRFKGTENGTEDCFIWNAEQMEPGIYYYQYRSGKYYKTGTLRLCQ